MRWSRSLDEPSVRRVEANLKEMGSRYLFIVLYVWLEQHLSRGDYRRRDTPPVTSERNGDRPIVASRSA